MLDAPPSGGSPAGDPSFGCDPPETFPPEALDIGRGEVSKPRPTLDREVVSSKRMRRVPVDLSSMVRGALAQALELEPGRRLGFFIQPGVTARTSDEPALQDLLCELVSGLVSSSTKSDVPTIIFDALGERRPSLYALTIVAVADDSTAVPIPDHARVLADALGAHLWHVKPGEGVPGSVCFTLEAGVA